MEKFTPSYRAGCLGAGQGFRDPHMGAGPGESVGLWVPSGCAQVGTWHTVNT